MSYLLEHHKHRECLHVNPNPTCTVAVLLSVVLYAVVAV